jgi:hypothetical protein
MMMMTVVAATCCIAAGNAHASTINFDGINASAGDVDLSTLSPYQGFNWSNFYAYTSQPGFPGFNNGIVSGPNAAYSGGEQASGGSVTPIIGSIQSNTPFSLVSADIGSGNYDNLNVTVEGLSGSTVLFTKVVSVNTGPAQLIDFGYAGITAVDLFATTTSSTSDPYACGAFDCTQFTLDNVTVTPAPVPEPATLGLLVSGLVSLLPFARRRGLSSIHKRG